MARPPGARQALSPTELGKCFQLKLLIENCSFQAAQSYLLLHDKFWTRTNRFVFQAKSLVLHCFA